jgi:hypothetical protein
MNHFWSATSSLVTIYFVSLILIGSYFALNLVLVRAGPHSGLAWGLIARFSSISHMEDAYTAGSLAQYCWWLFFSPEFFFCCMSWCLCTPCLPVSCSQAVIADSFSDNCREARSSTGTMTEKSIAGWGEPVGLRSGSRRYACVPCWGAFLLRTSLPVATAPAFIELLFVLACAPCLLLFLCLSL